MRWRRKIRRSHALEPPRTAAEEDVRSRSSICAAHVNDAINNNDEPTLCASNDIESTYTRAMLRALSRKLREGSHSRNILKRLRELQASSPSMGDLVDAAMNFGGKGNIKIRTIQKRSEILRLAEAVAAIKPQRILEIGTYRAGTLLLWSQIASHKVVTCDIELPPVKIPLYEQFPPPGSNCVVQPLKGNSHEESFKDTVKAAIGGPVDFLFIDGDHTEKGVEQDYDMYHGLVRPGGLIAFHDIVEAQPVEGNEVYYFWKRLKERLPEGSYEEFVDDQEQVGYGISLVRVPS